MPDLENDSKPSKLAEYDHVYWLDIYDYYHGKELDGLVDALMEELAVEGQTKLIRNNLRFLLTELRAASLGDENRYLVYSRAKSVWTLYKSWPNPNGLSYKIVEIVDALYAKGYLEGVGGFRDGVKRRSRCRATQKLKDLFSRYYVYHSIGQHPDTPLTWVTGEENKLVKIEPAWRKTLAASEALLATYNAFMEDVNVSVNVSLRDWNRSYEHKKILYRSYKQDIKHEGRFYGPWWQYLPKVQRRHILIDDKPTVELDYVCQALNLLYGYYADTSYQGTKGNPNPPADGYTVDGLPRGFTKLMFTVLVGASSKKKAWAGLREAIHEKRIKAEANMQKRIEGAEEEYQEAVDWVVHTSNDEECEKWFSRFVEIHTPLDPYLAKGLSLKLMNMDSLICEHIIRTLTEEEIPVLTIHDSFIVQEEHKDRLAQVMKEAYQLSYEGKSLSLAFGGIRVDKLGDKTKYIT